MKNLIFILKFLVISTLATAQLKTDTDNELKTSAQASSKSINRVLIGSSANPYTVLNAHQNCLTYNNDLGLIMFTHRKSIPISPPANSGYIQTTFSADNGSTWNNEIVYSHNTKLGRFPSGVIFNPQGNTNINNAYAVVAGPFADLATWKGSYFSSKTFGGQNAHTHIIDEDETIVGYTNLPSKWMDIDNSGRVRIMGEKNVGVEPNFSSYRTAIYTGIYNINTHSWLWSETAIIPPYALSSGGLPQGYTNPCVAWSKNGQTGYLIYVGRNLDAVDTLAFHPIIYKTSNGGITWMQQPGLDWNNIPSILNNTVPIYNNPSVKRASFGQVKDAVVDAQGFLHFSVFINSALSEHADSLTYTHTWSNKQGIMYHIFQSPTAWHAEVIATQWGLDVDVAHSYVGIPWDNRLQMSKTPDEDYIVFAWLDTDPLFDNYNIYPDIFVKAFNIYTAKSTPVKNLTHNTWCDADNFFMYLSNWSGFDSISNTIQLHLSTSVFGANPSDPADHYYVKGCVLPVLSITATATPSVICENDQSTLNVNITGGSGNHTYTWASNPAGFSSNLQNPIVSPTITTTYTVTVTDGSQTSSAAVALTVNPLPGAAGTISGQNTVCTGTSDNVYSVPFIPHADSYTWTIPNGTIITGCGTNEIYLSISSGALSGTVSVYGVNTCGIGASSSLPLTINQAPSVFAGNDHIITAGSTVALNGVVTGGSGNYSYAWAPSVLLNNPSILNPTTIPLNNCFFFRLFVTDNVTGCVQTDDVGVIIAGGPLSCNVTASNTLICSNSSVSLEAHPCGGMANYTYTWQSNPPGFSSTLKNPVVNPSVTTEYTVLVDDGMNLSTANVTINVINQTGSTITGAHQICQGINNVAYTLVGSTGITNYNWSLPPGASLVSGQGTNTIIVDYGSNAVSGDIIALGSTACGCIIDTLPIIIHGVPIANAGIDEVIYVGTTTNLHGLCIGGSGNYTYAWMPDTLLVNPNVQNPVSLPLNQTTNFLLVVTDVLTSCSSSDDVLVSVITAPLSVTATANPPIICEGSQSILTATPMGGTGTYTYSWTSNPSGFTSTLYNPTVSPIATTLYHVVVSDGTQSVTASVSVNVNPLPEAAGTITGPDTVNAGQMGVNYSVAPILNADSYVWTFPTGTYIVSGNNTNSVVVDFPLGAISGNISVYGINGCGYGVSSAVFPITIITGINELADNGFSLYPNPSDGHLIIEMKSPPKLLTLKVNNTLGQLVFETILKEEQRQGINLSHLSDGLYFITLSNEHFILTKKLLIKRTD